MVKVNELTPEQRLMWDIQNLQKSRGWKYIVDELMWDQVLLEVELKRKSTKIRTSEEIIDINYIWNKIELIEDLITMPKKILEQFDPVIDTDSPNT
jgi:hypothetical protein